MTAISVPMWSATSKAFSTLLSSKSFHSNSHGTSRRWPEDEIGKELGQPLDDAEDDGVVDRHGRSQGGVGGGSAAR